MATVRPISYSRISSYYYTCAYIYYLRYVLGVENNNTSLNRLWGKALHAAIELWHKSGETSDLTALMDAEFKQRLTEFHEDFEAIMDTTYDLRRDYIILLDDLSSRYKGPTSTKAWKEAEVVINSNRLRERTAQLAENIETLKWPAREDAFARALLHAHIATMYQNFHAANPLLKNPDESPMVEDKFTFSVAGHEKPYIAIVDQGRMLPDADGDIVPMPVDLKTWADPIDPSVIGRYQQGIHYQLGWMLTPDTHPTPGGFAIYDLRTGKVETQPAISTAAANDWLSTCHMVQLAEQHGIFPPRDDNKCTQCDYQSHCATRHGG